MPAKGLGNNSYYTLDGSGSSSSSKKKKEEETVVAPIVYAPANVKAPTAPTYLTNTVAKPTYTSPTTGATYNYSKAAPTWQWDDSVRPGDWSWDEEKPTYTNEYQDQINQMVNDILNRPSFSYDYNQDPLYQQYAEAYTRNGRQAMNDTYAQMAARTGGLASSYAGTASQQAYNNYMNALNDKIPELQQIAYSMYMDEGNTMRNNLGMVQGLENTAYGRYLDNLGQWNTDRNFSYGQYQDAWDRYYNDRNFSYGQYSDDWDRWNTNRNWDYNLWQDNLSRQEAAARAAYNNQLAAYNAEQNRVNAANAQLKADYDAQVAAYNAVKNQPTAYTSTRQLTGGNASNPQTVAPNASSAAARTVQSTGVGKVMSFGGKNWDLSNPTELRNLIEMINTMPLSESKKKSVMNDINSYLK